MSEILLILASSSPRRLALLADAGIPCRVIAPDVEECHRPHETPEEYVRRNAREKADWVCGQGPHQEANAVLAADTIVVLDGRILEKPRDPADAVDMLQRLSGRAHQVLTGVSLYRLDQGHIRDRQVLVETTSVRFRTLDIHEISTYVASQEPMDKAGAYAIQGRGGDLVSTINGSYTNVVGLPMEPVTAILNRWKSSAGQDTYR